MTQLADEASTSAATKAAERISGKKCDKINDERALDVFYYVNVLDFKDITETNIQNNQQRTNSLLLKYNNQFQNNQENFSNQLNNFSNLNQNSKNNNGFVACYPGMKGEFFNDLNLQVISQRKFDFGAQKRKLIFGVFRRLFLEIIKKFFIDGISCDN